MRHPLVNAESKHYKADGKPSAIELLENILTLEEMIGLCRGNIFKYEYRKDHKGQAESDQKKIYSYRKYLYFLYFLRDIDGQHKEYKNVRAAIDDLGIKIEY